MKNYNLEILSKKNWTFIVIKNNKIVCRSKKEGLKPLLFCLKYKKTLLKNALVYDKVVGRAAAHLMIYGQIKKVLTPVISHSALKELKKHKIEAEYQTIARKILNKSGADVCPMEKLSQNKKPDEFARIMLAG